MTRFATLAALAAFAAAPAFAAPQTYTIDSSHAQIVFSYNHVGYSTGYGMFSGFGGSVVYDADAPAASSVSVSFPVRSMLTGWEARFEHFMSPDFFDAAEDEMVTFTSTAVEVTGATTGKITGDLTLNGVTKSVVLDAVLNKAEPYPLPPFEGKPAVGFSATTTLIRSEFGLGNYAPFISDEVQVQITFEAMVTE
jgi:polyisoprenoid-binding protein YceI